MADENTNTSASGEAQRGGASSGSQGETLESLKAEIEKLKKHNADILGEKKSVTQKLSQFEKEKQEREEKDLEAKGNFEALLKSEREKNQKLGLMFKAHKMDTQVKDALLNAGCSREKVEKVMKFQTVSNYGEKVSFDEEFNADKSKLSSFVEEIKKELPEFFVQKAPDAKDVNPSNVQPKQEPKTLRAALADIY